MKDVKLIMESWKGWRRNINEAEEIAMAAEEEAAGPQPETEEEAAQWLANQIAPLIKAADAGNYTEPLAQLVSRINSSAGMSPAVRELLALGDVDGDDAEVLKVKVKQYVPAPELTPTQAVIDLRKSAGFNGSNAGALAKVLGGTSGAPPILAVGKPGAYFIIDGHHRWSGAVVYNQECLIPANVLMMDPGKALLVSQLAIAAYVGPKKLPSASAKAGLSIIGPGAMDESKVYKFLKNSIGEVLDQNAGGAFMNPQVLQVVKQYKFGMGGMVTSDEEVPDEEEALQEGEQMQDALLAEGACKEVAKNCATLGQKYAAEGPPREIMPQFEPKVGGPDFDAIRPEFETGKINYLEPFIKVGVATEEPVAQVAESRIRRSVRNMLLGKKKRKRNIRQTVRDMLKP